MTSNHYLILGLTLILVSFIMIFFLCKHYLLNKISYYCSLETSSLNDVKYHYEFHKENLFSFLFFPCE